MTAEKEFGVREEALDLAVDSLKTRARHFKKEGILYLVLLLLIGCGVVTLFTFQKEASRTIIVSGLHTSEPVTINQNTDEWRELAKAAILRMGAVLLAVFLIQILVTLCRQRFKVSEVLYARAIALQLSKGEISLLDSYGKLLSSEHIDFGGLPRNPYESAFNAVSRTINPIRSNQASREEKAEK